jgi:hypothetical protein
MKPLAINGYYSRRKAVPWLRRLVAGFPPRRPVFDPKSGHMGFVVDNAALGQVFSEYFGFPCQFSFHRLLHIHHLSSGAGTIGQLVADVPSGLSLPTPRKKNMQKEESDTRTSYSFIEVCCNTSLIEPLFPELSCLRPVDSLSLSLSLSGYCDIILQFLGRTSCYRQFCCARAVWSRGFLMYNAIAMLHNS